MTLHLPRWLLLALVAGALCTFPAVSAQNTPSQSAGAVPRTTDGKPDFSGTYQWPTYLPGRSNATIFTAPWSQEFEIIARPEWKKTWVVRIRLSGKQPLPRRKVRGEK